MTDQSHKFEDKVMSEITSGHVKLRSKYVFLAEKLGLGSAFALSVLLAVLFFNMALFYLKASDNLGYLSFGSRGFLVFLESFPYLLVVCLVALIFIAGLIMKRSEISYRKPFGYFAVALIVFITIAGVVLAYTKINERIEREAFGPKRAGMFFKPFLRGGLDERQRGVAGRITEIGDGFVIIQTPMRTSKVDINNLEEQPAEPLAIGLFIMAIGDRKDDIFVARRIRVMSEEDMEMIRRGVHRRFGTSSPMMRMQR